MSKNAISYYGKIPSYGDFISHLVPRTFTGVWDAWLQESLVHWRDTLGERWVADYLTMLPYRFILSAGIAGEVVWCGVIFASRDHAGRLFPFTICVPLSASKTNPFALFDACQEWLAELEQIATQCLTANFKKDDLRGSFQEELDQLAARWSSVIAHDTSYTCANHTVIPEAAPQELFAWHSQTLPQTVRQTAQGENKVIGKASLTNLSYPMLDSVLVEFCHGYSLWWTKDNDDFSLCQGLPTKEMTSAFIDKQWRQRGWLLHG